MLDALQWPAFIASLLAAWLIASNTKRLRNAGFWVFLLSNVLWMTWGWHSQVANDFDSAFAEGTLQEFQAWLSSPDPGWVLLDSIDESRLRSPLDFEAASSHERSEFE